MSVETSNTLLLAVLLVLVAAQATPAIAGATGLTDATTTNESATEAVQTGTPPSESDDGETEVPEGEEETATSEIAGDGTDADPTSTESDEPTEPDEQSSTDDRTTTETETATATETPTETETSTEAETETEADTPTEIETETPESDGTATQSGRPTETETPAVEPTPTEAATPEEQTATTAHDGTRSGTPAETETSTQTPPETEASTHSPTPTPHETPVETGTQTPSERPTETATPSTTASQSEGATNDVEGASDEVTETVRNTTDSTEDTANESANSSRGSGSTGTSERTTNESVATVDEVNETADGTTSSVGAANASESSPTEGSETVEETATGTEEGNQSKPFEDAGGAGGANRTDGETTDRAASVDDSVNTTETTGNATETADNETDRSPGTTNVETETAAGDEADDTMQNATERTDGATNSSEESGETVRTVANETRSTAETATTAEIADEATETIAEAGNGTVSTESAGTNETSSPGNRTIGSASNTTVVPTENATDGEAIDPPTESLPDEDDETQSAAGITNDTTIDTYAVNGAEEAANGTTTGSVDPLPSVDDTAEQITDRARETGSEGVNETLTTVDEAGEETPAEADDPVDGEVARSGAELLNGIGVTNGPDRSSLENATDSVDDQVGSTGTSVEPTIDAALDGETGNETTTRVVATVDETTGSVADVSSETTGPIVAQTDGVTESVDGVAAAVTDAGDRTIEGGTDAIGTVSDPTDDTVHDADVVIADVDGALDETSVPTTTVLAAVDGTLVTVVDESTSTVDGTASELLSVDRTLDETAGATVLEPVELVDEVAEETTEPIVAFTDTDTLVRALVESPAAGTTDEPVDRVVGLREHRTVLDDTVRTTGIVDEASPGRPVTDDVDFRIQSLDDADATWGTPAGASLPGSTVDAIADDESDVQSIPPGTDVTHDAFTPGLGTGEAPTGAGTVVDSMWAPRQRPDRRLSTARRLHEESSSIGSKRIVDRPTSPEPNHRSAGVEPSSGGGTLADAADPDAVDRHEQRRNGFPSGGIPVPDTSTAVGLIGAIAVSTALAKSSDALARMLTTAPVSPGLQARTAVQATRSWFADVPRRLPIPGYSRYDESDPLENEQRATLHEAITASPGVNLGTLVERTDVSRSSARYHLRVLEHEGLVSSEKVRGKRRLYPVGVDDVELQAAARDEVTRAVLEAIARHEPVSGSTLADVLDRDASTVTHHLKQLSEAELVDRQRDGRSIVNWLTPAGHGAVRSSEPGGAASDRIAGTSD